MNSAPAVLRTPSIAIESIPCMSIPSVDHNESYPWAAYTPENSPRCYDASPKSDCCAPLIQMQPVLSQELLQTVCAPYFDQMLRSVKTDPFVRKMPADMISTDMLQPMCEPFFEQMVSALQQTLQQQSTQPMQDQQFNMAQSMMNNFQPSAGACFQPVFYPSNSPYHFDEDSTSAEDSGPFNSLLSTSSEGEGVDAMESKSEDTSDVERSVMVCRHWKSKGWCRMESGCKFLHPDHKCGVSVPAGDNVAETGRRKKKGGKNRSRKGPEEQLSN